MINDISNKEVVYISGSACDCYCASTDKYPAGSHLGPVPNSLSCRQSCSRDNRGNTTCLPYGFNIFGHVAGWLAGIMDPSIGCHHNFGSHLKI